jgi:hypothetical protein
MNKNASDNTRCVGCACFLAIYGAFYSSSPVIFSDTVMVIVKDFCVTFFEKVTQKSLTVTNQTENYE